MPAPLPPDEIARLAALRNCGVLDTPTEPFFDELTRKAAAVCGVPVAFIGLIDERREWFKSRIGLAPGEIPREQTFCSYAMLRPERPMVVRDALKDERFADNPLVVGPPHLRSYAGVPLRSPEGHALGAFCVMDTVPRQFSLHKWTSSTPWPGRLPSSCRCAGALPPAAGWELFSRCC